MGHAACNAPSCTHAIQQCVVSHLHVCVQAIGRKRLCSVPRCKVWINNQPAFLCRYDSCSKTVLVSNNQLVVETMVTMQVKTSNM
jgi:hypothetical protein